MCTVHYWMKFNISLVKARFLHQRNIQKQMKGDTNFGAALSISTALSGTFRVTRTFCFAEEAILRTWLALEKFLQINPRDSLAKWVYDMPRKRRMTYSCDDLQSLFVDRSIPTLELQRETRHMRWLDTCFQSGVKKVPCDGLGTICVAMY